MLLKRLKEYADTRMELPPQLYSETAVRYIIELDATGRFLGITDTSDPSNPRTKRGRRYLMPQVTRTSGIKPLLITDKPDYVLGLSKEEAKLDRAQAAHAAYRALLERCAAATEAPEIRAVQKFLNDGCESLRIPEDFDLSNLITFRVDGVFPTELSAVQAFWARENAQDGDQAVVMQCIICGQRRPVLRSLQGTIKGIPGGQSSGTAIISANAKAFESYGLENSLIAPTCADCGERSTKALNELLASEQHRVILAGMAFVFWTRRPDAGFDFGLALTHPESQQFAATLQSLFKGKQQPNVDEGAFYAVTLSASGGRTVVRDWLDTTVGDAKRALARWFALQRIADDTGTVAPPLGLYGLAGATVRELRDLPVTTARSLVRAALIGTPLPLALLYQAVRRSRAEQSVTRQRAALIKLVLLSNATESEEGAMVELDTDRGGAYRYGRLLAVLAEIQRNAIGKAAIVDRFYGTASSAPASVFARLLRGAQPHLSKLERDKRGLAIILQERLEEVMSGITTFPTTLTLEEQGLFALGFYHQRAYDRAQIAARAARKRGDGAAPSSETESDV